MMAEREKEQLILLEMAEKSRLEAELQEQERLKEEILA